jgi:hypothetical protein
MDDIPVITLSDDDDIPIITLSDDDDIPIITLSDDDDDVEYLVTFSRGPQFLPGLQVTRLGRPTFNP